PAGAALALSAQQAAAIERACRRVGQQGGVVVCEDECVRIVRVALAARARVAGAEIAAGVVGRALLRRALLDLPLARALGAVRRDQHPLTAQWVIAAVGMIAQVKHSSLPIFVSTVSARYYTPIPVTRTISNPTAAWWAYSPTCCCPSSFVLCPLSLV